MSENEFRLEMAGKTPTSFSPSLLEKKLKDLNTTLQSIQSVSQWLIHYRKHAKLVVIVWFKELQKADAGRKLTLLYLANDVIQNSKRKGLEYKLEFTRALPRSFQLVSKEKDDSLHKAVQRIISVWEERSVFEQESLVKFKAILSSGSLHAHRRTKSESDARRAGPPEPKKMKLISPEDSPLPEEPPNNRTPPEAGELLGRMVAIDGDRSVAKDLETRQKIASFPPEIHDPSLLARTKDLSEAERLAVRVGEASKVLKEYNSRLEAECKEREEIQELLDAFIWQQKGHLKSTRLQLKEHQGKLERVTVVREELKSHLASLPDLPRGVVGSLAPLPSVGELFN